jgi:hypothetical protein
MLVCDRRTDMSATTSIDHMKVSMVTGSPKEVRAKIDASNVEQVIALTFAHATKESLRAVVETIRSITPLVSVISEKRQKERLESIISNLVPDVPLPEHMMREARMVAEARNAVLTSAEWLTAAQISEMAGFSSTNPGAQPNKWKKDGLIFAVHHKGTDYFPGYGLDPKSGYRPCKGLAEVIRIFGVSKDAWGIAYWFASENSFLGSSRPQDLLLKQPKKVIDAAIDETAGVLHG